MSPTGTTTAEASAIGAAALFLSTAFLYRRNLLTSRPSSDRNGRCRHHRRRRGSADSSDSLSDGGPSSSDDESQDIKYRTRRLRDRLSFDGPDDHHFASRSSLNCLARGEDEAARHSRSSVPSSRGRRRGTAKKKVANRRGSDESDRSLVTGSVIDALDEYEPRGPRGERHRRRATAATSSIRRRREPVLVQSDDVAGEDDILSKPTSTEEFHPKNRNWGHFEECAAEDEAAGICRRNEEEVVFRIGGDDDGHDDDDDEEEETAFVWTDRATPSPRRRGGGGAALGAEGAETADDESVVAATGEKTKEESSESRDGAIRRRAPPGWVNHILRTIAGGGAGGRGTSVDGDEDDVSYAGDESDSDSDALMDDDDEVSYAGREVDLIDPSHRPPRNGDGRTAAAAAPSLPPPSGTDRPSVARVTRSGSAVTTAAATTTARSYRRASTAPIAASLSAPAPSSSRMESARADYNARIMPSRVVMVRHGQSEGNVCESLYATKSDNAMRLTKLGWRQAKMAGEALRREVLERGESVHFIVSPYVRTVETFHGLVSAWCDPREFDGIENREERVKAWYGRLLEMGLTWHEDPRIREQDFGNYQDPATIRKCKRERHKFGVFYYRFPHGESASDVFDRVSTFLDSLWRSFDLQRSRNYVLVTHGISIRVLLARYFRYSIDQFNMLANPKNCEMVILGHDGNGKLRLDGRCELEVRSVERSPSAAGGDAEGGGDNDEAARDDGPKATSTEVVGYKFHKRLRVLPRQSIVKRTIRVSCDDKLEPPTRERSRPPDDTFSGHIL